MLQPTIKLGSMIYKTNVAMRLSMQPQKSHSPQISYEFGPEVKVGQYSVIELVDPEWSSRGRLDRPDMTGPRDR